MAQRFAVFAGLICSLLTVHCTDVSSSGNSCTLNTDCPLPEVCIENRCRLECRIDSDCADGERCLDSVCVDPFADCLSDADCREFGLICDVITRRCRPPGGADAARPDAAEPADRGLDLDARPRVDASTPVDAARPPVDMARPPVDMARPPVDMARPPVDMARPPVDMARPPVDQGVPDQGFVRGDARYGEPCECGADCRSGLCLRNPLNNLERQCTDVCDQVRCPGVDRCLHLAVPAVREGCADPGLGPVGTPLDVCVPNETGTPCANPEQCLFEGICVDPPNPVPRAVRTQPTCSAQCEGNQDCPSGFRCEAVRAADGQQIRICNAATEIAACPDGTNLTCGRVCPVPGGVDPLDISRCLLFENRAPGMCSCDCASAADCPVGFACVKEVFDFPDQAPGRPGVCLPIAGYTCPNGDDDCLSLFCAGQHPDEPFSRCTAPCLNRADCPANYECVQPPGLEFSICVANPPP